MSYERFSESSGIIDFLVGLSRELRRRGVRVSTSELVDAATVIENYLVVRGLTLEDLAQRCSELVFVLSSLLAKREGDRAIIEEVACRHVDAKRPRVKDMLLAIARELERARLDYGVRISAGKRRRLLGSSESAESYARLKILGVIRRVRGGERVLSRGEVIDLLRGLARQGRSLDDVLRRRLVQAAERGEDIVLTLFRDAQRLHVFDDISLDAAVKLAETALRRGAVGEARVLADIVARRVRTGEVVDAYRAYNVLRRLGVVDDSVLLKLASSDRAVASMLARESWEVFDRILRGASLERAARLIAGLAHDPRMREKAAQLLDKGVANHGVLLAEHLLSHTPRVKDGVFSVLSLVGSARESMLAGLASGDTAFTDYALYQLLLAERKLDSIEEYRHLQSAIHTLIKNYRSLILGNSSVLVRLAAQRGMVDVALVEELLRLVHSPNHRVRAAARRLLHIVLSYTRRKLRGRGRIVRRRAGVARAGCTRVDVYRLVRARLLWDYGSLRYVRKERRGRIILVLDKSGSMRPYAVTAILAASAFAGIVDRFVVFDTKVAVYSGRSARNPYRLLDIVLSTSFEGYTDVIGALRFVQRLSTASRVVVLISDLRQTVGAGRVGEELVTVFRELYGRGWRVFVLSPPSIDRRVRSSISKYAAVYVIDEPSSVEEALVRILSRL